MILHEAGHGRFFPQHFKVIFQNYPYIKIYITWTVGKEQLK
jgi:hypothetical protein